MALIAKCACGKSFQAKAELAGKKVKCPACGGGIQVPALSVTAPVPQYSVDLNALDEVLKSQAAAGAASGSRANAVGGVAAGNTTAGGTSVARFYVPSGKVNWAAFLPLALVTLFAAVAAATVMGALRFYVIYVPVILCVSFVVLTALVLNRSVWSGHCRNRGVGLGLGILSGLIIILGHFQVEHALAVGAEGLIDVGSLPDVIIEHIENDVVTRVGRIPGKPNGKPMPIINALLFVVDLSLSLGMCGAAGWIVAGRPYNERTGKWSTRRFLVVPPLVRKELKRAIQENRVAAVLAKLQEYEPESMGKFTMLIIDVIPGAAGGVPQYFLSATDHVASAPMSVARAGAVISFPAVRHLSLTPHDVASAQHLFR